MEELGAEQSCKKNKGEKQMNRLRAQRAKPTVSRVRTQHPLTGVQALGPKPQLLKAGGN